MHDTADTGAEPLYMMQLRGPQKLKFVASCDYKNECKSCQFNKRTSHNITDRQTDKFNSAVLVQYLSFTRQSLLQL